VARKDIRLAKSVIDGLLDDIAAGHLKPGDEVAPEAALAARFDVSKPVVREAMARLSVQGIVAIRRGRQTVVLPFSSAALESLFGTMSRAYDISDDEFFALRRAVEIEVAGLAALQAKPADIVTLSEAVETMAAEIRTIEPWVEADIAFHRCLAEITGQRFLVQLLGALEASTRDVMRGAKVRRDLATTQLSLRTHIELVEAIRARNPAAARQAMAAHFEIVAGFRTAMSSGT